MEVRHYRPTPPLVQFQPLLRQQPEEPGETVGTIHPLELQQHILHLVRERIVHVREVPSGMGKAVTQESLQLARNVAVQRVAHLHRRRQSLVPLQQHLPQVLSRMVGAREEQHHRWTAIGLRQDTRGKHALSIRCILPQRLLVLEFGAQLLDSHIGIVVVHQIPLGSDPGKVVVGVLESAAESVSYNFPLHRRRQRNPGAALHVFDPLPGYAQPIAQDADRAGDRGIVLGCSRILRRFRRVRLAAQAAPQAFQLVTRTTNGRLTKQANQLPPLVLTIECPVLAIRARIARMQRPVMDQYLLATGIGFGRNATVTRPAPLPARAAGRRVFRRTLRLFA